MTPYYRCLSQVLVLIFPLVVIGFCGCGQKLPDGMPRLHPCTITVTMNGKPLEKAKVTLFPEEGGENQGRWGCAGFTNSSGSVTMKTDGRYQGIPAGKYVVTVYRVDIEEREYQGYFEEQQLPPPKSTVIVDLKYDDPEQSPLVLEVGRTGNEKKFAFEVTAALDPELPKNYGMLKATRSLQKPKK